MRLNIIKILFMLTLFSISLPYFFWQPNHTSLFTDKGESAYGVWGNVSTFNDCSSCDKNKILSFDYVSSFGLGLSLGRSSTNNYLTYDFASLSYAFRNDNLSYLLSMTENMVDGIDTSTRLVFKAANSKGYTFELSSLSVEDNYTYPYTYIEEQLVEQLYYNYTCFDSYTEYYMDINGFPCTSNLSDAYSYNELEYSYDFDFGYYNGGEFLPIYDNIEVTETYYGYSEFNEQYLKIGKFFNVNSYIMGIEYYNVLKEFDDIKNGVILFTVGSVF